jgi:hypothetical protein
VIKFHRLLLVFILICLILLGIIIFISWQPLNNQRTKLCHPSKTLTQIEVKNYDDYGVNRREGTYDAKLSLVSNKTLKVIIFPNALSPQIWSKVPQSSIQYLGKGGDETWQEWLRPDYFYLLTVPPQATGLAFGRLCYRNGDVDVESIKKLKKVFYRKIVINDKIYLSHSYPLTTDNPYTLIVNTGSNHRDSLGTQTEVYFTTRVSQ